MIMPISTFQRFVSAELKPLWVVGASHRVLLDEARKVFYNDGTKVEEGSVVSDRLCKGV